jgi:flagellar export protein FliJ
MRSLATLLKVATQQLETVRRALAAEQARRRRLEDRLAAQAAAMAAEQQFAQHDQEAALALPAYVVRSTRERKAIEAERDLVSAEIDRFRALVSEAHIEVRKFERLIELEQQRERVRREKREDAELDEMATLRSGRR